MDEASKRGGLDSTSAAGFLAAFAQSKPRWLAAAREMPREEGAARS